MGKTVTSKGWVKLSELQSNPIFSKESPVSIMVIYKFLQMIKIY